MRLGSIYTLIGFVLLGVLALVLYALSLPTTLRIAVGPEDREHATLAAALAQRFKTDRAPLRLAIVRKANLAEAAAALDAGEVDLAVARSDHMPRNGLTVAIMNRSPVVLVSPGPRPVDMARLAGKRVGVARGSPENLALLDMLLQQVSVPPARVARESLDIADIGDALAERRFDALMVVAPLQSASIDRVTRMLSEGSAARASFAGVPDADAVAKRHPELELMEVPRGVFGGSPPRPPEDLSTVAISLRLVASTKMADATAGDFARGLFTRQPALVSEVPMARFIEPPETDDPTALPIHPGVVKYLNGDQQNFIERYSDVAYLGAMLATLLASGAGAMGSYWATTRRRESARFIEEAVALLARARAAASADELAQIEQQSDRALALAVSSASHGAIDGTQFASFAAVHQAVGDALAKRRVELATAATGA